MRLVKIIKWIIKFKINIILFAVLIPLLSCLKGGTCCDEPALSIYKLNDTSYINYLPVCKKGICFPGQTFKASPMKMHKGYYLEYAGFSMFGPNIVVLDIKITDYDKLGINFNYDSLRMHVLSDDPFAEFYYDSNYILGGGGNPKYWDTTKLNQIIDAGELAKYFEKLK